MNRLFLQCGVSVFMGLFAVCRTRADAYTEYYWTGAVDYGTATTNLSVAGNWARADGTTATAAPGSTTMLIFTNDTPIVLSGSTGCSCYGMRFYGVNVNLPSAGEKKSNNVYAGGVEVHGTGTLYRPFYSMNTKGTSEVVYDIPADKTFAIHYMFQSSDTSTPVKRGAGTLQIPRYRATRMIIEEGMLYSSGGQWNAADLKHDFTLRGGADKCLYINNPYDNEGKKRGFWMSGGSFAFEDGAADADFELRGKTAYTLYFDGDQPDSQINARLTDEDENIRTFRYCPNTTSTTLTWIKVNLDSAYWGITATNGVVKFADGVQVTQLRYLAVYEDGKIVFDCATAGANLSGAPWEVHGNGMFSVKGRKLFKVPGVTVDGAAVPAGFYTKETAPWLASDNEAMIIVGTPAEPETVAATWVGGSDGNSIFANANWQGGTAPDLATFATVATFPDGATVVIPANTVAKLKGFVTQGAFTVSGAGTLWTGSEGLTTGGTGALSIGCTVQVAVDQTWTVANHNVDFTVDSQLVMARGVDWRIVGWAKTGDTKSQIRMYASNPQFYGASFVGGSGNQSANTVNVHAYADNALGGARAYTVFTYGRLSPHGVSLDGDFYWPLIAYSSPFVYLYNGENVFTGFVNANTQNDAMLASDSTSKGTVRFKGGFRARRDINKTNYLNFNSQIRNVYFDSAADIQQLRLNEANINLWFNAAGNDIARGICLYDNNCVVHTTVPDAFAAGSGEMRTPGFIFYENSGTWNLHDCDQYIEVLCGTNATGKAVVTSAGDALVKLNARTMHYEPEAKYVDATRSYEKNGQTVDGVSFRGGAGIEKSGPIDHYMMGTSTSTGRVSVVEGRLVFTRAATNDTDVIVVPGSTVADVNVLRKPASWQTASSVSVSGTGTLVLEHDKVFGKKVNVSIDTSAGAKIELPAGAQMRCSTLTVDGKPVRGIYSGSGVTGGTIFAGTPGMVVIFR